MYVEVSSDGARVREPETLTSLSVRAEAGLDRAALAGALVPLGRLEGGHAWLEIEALRHAAGADVPAESRPEWDSGFEGMIAYASSKGWVADGAVRAHLESLGP